MSDKSELYIKCITRKLNDVARQAKSYKGSAGHINWMPHDIPQAIRGREIICAAKARYKLDWHKCIHNAVLPGFLEENERCELVGLIPESISSNLSMHIENMPQEQLNYLLYEIFDTRDGSSVMR